MARGVESVAQLRIRLKMCQREIWVGKFGWEDALCMNRLPMGGGLRHAQSFRRVSELATLEKTLWTRARSGSADPFSKTFQTCELLRPREARD